MCVCVYKLNKKVKDERYQKELVGTPEGVAAGPDEKNDALSSNA